MDEKMEIYGLAYDCPYRQRKNNCLLKGFDCYSFVDKIKIINVLSQDEK